jgi:hypothetical protein
VASVIALPWNVNNERWLDGKARYEIVLRSIYDEIVKLYTLGASGWTENRRGGKRRIVERTLPRRSASCKARRLPRPRASSAL